jgi:hypothetical protein
MHGLKKSIIKKKLFLLTRLRKKYLDFKKTKILSILRSNFRPLEEERKCEIILSKMKQRR